MRRLKGASLLETIVAAVIFLLVFTTALELMPRLTVRSDDAALVTEADYHVMSAFRRYAAGNYPFGTYAEQYDWGEILIRITPYKEFCDVQSLEVTAHIKGSKKQISIKQIIQCTDLQAAKSKAPHLSRCW